MSALASMRVTAIAGALQLAVALAMPALYQAILRLSSAQTAAMRAALLALAGLVVVALGLGALLGVRRVRSEAALPDRRAAARRRALALPLDLAAVMLGCEAAGLVALGISLWATHAPIQATVGVLVSTAAVLALLPVPLFAIARPALLPLAISVGEEPPDDHGWSIANQLGYGIAAVAFAVLVPAAVFGAAELDRAAAADARSRAEVTGERLARAASALDVAAATTLVTRTPLADTRNTGLRTIYRAPSGTLLPEDAEAELEDEPHVEVPLQGALRGGLLRVYYISRPVPRAALFAATLAILLVTLALAHLLGRAVARDLVGVAHQIERVARDEEPGRLPAVATGEVRRLTQSVNRLLERIPRFTVESFLAIERAEDAQRLKSQFLANMSHDLRSPLNSILGFSELLLRGVEGEISMQHRAKLHDIQDHGNHLLRLLNEILDTAKVESGKMELHRQSAPPVELVRASMQEAHRGRRATDNRVEIVLQPGMHLIHADPLRVQQAVTHLLNWALDATGEQVLLRASELGEASMRRFVVELEVKTEISDDAAQSLFDAFRPTAYEPGKRPGGLHLALPLARRLAVLHGGTLELTSRSPARLKMVLPVVLPVGLRLG
jgi:signal transduction histidine kinase